MKHILHTGNIIFGAEGLNPHSLVPHVSEVLEQWANETNYTGSLSELSVMTISTSELIYFEEKEQHYGQAINEFTHLVETTKGDGVVLIVTTYPSVDLEKELNHEYQDMLKEHFHVINNWNKQTAK